MATITPADLATALGTDARTARKFLRSITPKDSHPGKGARWAIEKRDVRSLRTKFAAFRAEEDRKRSEREANRAETAPAVENETPDESLDALEGPSDEDLAGEETNQD